MKRRGHPRPWKEVEMDELGQEGQGRLGIVASWDLHFLQREKDGEREVTIDV